jgi:AraC-like DNA-binding protein
MYVTKRTLQRRPEQEGTNYRALTEQMIAELAARHLRDTALTIEALSTLLGYCDTAAFRKAFHRWYGQSPSEYRCCIRNRCQAKPNG